MGRMIPDTRDGSWVATRLPVRFQLFLATFGLLVLELALIRWSASQVRVLAYFTNLVLIASFLGMGLGVVLGARRPGLTVYTLPSLALLCLVFALSDRIGLMHIGFPDPSVSLWGGEWDPRLTEFLLSLGIIFSLFWTIVLVFLLAGAAVGHLFSRLEANHAYTFDLLGSLAGVLAISACTSLNTGPHIWFLAGVVPFVALTRRPVAFLGAAVVLLLTYHSAGGAVFSPYNRIDLETRTLGKHADYYLAVNRDFHQFMHDLSDEALRDSSLTEAQREERRGLKLVYDLPFLVSSVRGSALIVGAGTGNDVQAALRNGYAPVYSVDIDGRIIALGQRFHPEKPYANPATIPVVNDARAFFEQYRGPGFKTICYGLLDSHAMFSALSTLRLDNYVYTVEGIRAAWNHLDEDGHLSLCFSIYAGDWIADRLYWTLVEATGRRPIMVNHGLNWGCTYFVAKRTGSLNYSPASVFPFAAPKLDRSRTRITSDDWPFLYVRPGRFPSGYVALLGRILVSGCVAIGGAFGRGRFVREFDAPMFWMGAAFLLLETRGVTLLSLLFGSTWIVNACVFSGILTVALVANMLVGRWRPADPRVWFLPLGVSLVALYLFNPGWLSGMTLLPRGIIGGLVNALPVGFAGIIVSTLLSRSRNVVASLGSNLLGALLGGCLEYLSMWVGLKALTWVIAFLYLLAYLHLRRRQTGPAARTTG